MAALLDLAALASMVAITWLVWRRGDGRALVLGSLTATVVFAACGKVLSPQYLIWVIPLFALAAAWRMHALAAAVGTAMLLTFIMFPVHFHDVVFQRTPWLVEVGVRNLLLLSAILGWRSGSSLRSGPRCPPNSGSLCSPTLSLQRLRRWSTCAPELRCRREKRRMTPLF